MSDHLLNKATLNLQAQEILLEEVTCDFSRDDHMMMEKLPTEEEVKKTLDREISMPMKVAVMGCVVNGPGEAEGADVAVFAGNKRGIIYVQGERVANVKEEEILESLLAECKRFEDKVNRGEAKLGQKNVEIVPPAPIGELGSGADKIASGDVEQITIGKS